MIDLVLQGDGKKSFGCNLDFFFMFIESDDFHLRGATHFRGKVDDAKASLLPDDFPLRPGNYWIDELIYLLMRIFVVDIQHDHPLGYTHLRRREPDAWRSIHCFHQVINQLYGLPGDIIYRQSLSAQDRLRVFYDLQDRHTLQTSITNRRDRHQCEDAHYGIEAPTAPLASPI